MSQIRRWMTLCEMRFDDLGEGYWITDTGRHVHVDAEHLDIAARAFPNIVPPDSNGDFDAYSSAMGDFNDAVVEAIDAHGWIRVIVGDDEYGIEVRNWPAVTKAALGLLLHDATRSDATTYFIDDLPQQLTKPAFLATIRAKAAATLPRPAGG